jgi:hypothetical protein
MMRTAAAGIFLALAALAPAQQAAAQDPWWHGGCYYRYPNGAWMQIQPGYCDY